MIFVRFSKQKYILQKSYKQNKIHSKNNNIYKKYENKHNSEIIKRKKK